jgi:hypothetical protein
MVNIVFINNKSKSVSLLCAELITGSKVSRKVVWSDPGTEVSGTANTCNDPKINSRQAEEG